MFHGRRNTGSEANHRRRDTVFDDGSPSELYEDLLRKLKHDRSFEFKIKRPAVVTSSQ